MVQGKYQQVIEMLDNSAETADLYAYSRYNLGVALIKNGRVKDGITLLDELGSREITDTDRDTETAEEVLALQDKANLALGYYYIKRRDAAERESRIIERYEGGIEGRNAPFPVFLYLTIAGTVIWVIAYILMIGLLKVKY